MLEDARGVGDKSRGVAREEKDRVSVVLQEARAKRNAREYCRVSARSIVMFTTAVLHTPSS